MRGSLPGSGWDPRPSPSNLLDDASWKHWKDHLNGFQKRRDQRISDGDRLASRMVQKRRGVQQAFGRFTAIARGAILDVGCGPGKLRFNFDPKLVDYYGIDPTPLREVRDFPYAKALAEYLPFRDGVFTDVVVVSALDHFQDCTQFFNETSRVLKTGGRLHVVQTIHKPKNPIKRITHWVKDALEDHATKDVKGDAPHHMWEFTRSSFLDTVSQSFKIVGQKEYSRNWYSPDKVFLTLARDRAQSIASCWIVALGMIGCI